ncbi:MAG: hydrogenase formation protein HypD [Clostridia bacterium]|jgi:hydrogenase expression/formation protein HypD
MDSIEELFRNSDISKKMGEILRSYKGKQVTLMEVCGTHTMAIHKYGIKNLLPSSVKLVSGPGCPICVTPGSFVRTAITLSRDEDVIITTFGDMIRVPCDGESLLDEKSKGSDIRIVYSPLESIKIAQQEKNKRVVFLSIGFETTTPVCALTVLKADELRLKNFSMLTANKTIPDVMEILSADENLGIDGFIYPGHVSAITGNSLYRKIAQNCRIPGVVAGFEPMDILHAIITLIRMINKNEADVINEYSRIVKEDGNQIARNIVNEVFEESDSVWRGLGNIPNSGMKLRQKYTKYDAHEIFDVKDVDIDEPAGCLCGDVLKGIKIPPDCLLFGRTCTPGSPVGACMVSSEGTCSAYYKYGQ